MEVIEKKRNPIRTQFIKNYDLIIQEVAKEEIDRDKVKITFKTLERLKTTLNTLDEEVCNFLLENESDDNYSKEIMAIEEFNEKYDCISVKVENIFSYNIVVNESAVDASAPGSIAVSNQMPGKRRSKLPKIELQKFNGEIRCWLSFWSQFQRVHLGEDLDDDDRISYLIQAMVPGTRAREVVDSFPATGENYNKVIHCLKRRFGRDQLLIEFYVRELLSLVIKNAVETKNRLSTSQLYDRLESYLRSLESIGVTCDKFAAMLCPLVESCIPEEIFRAWLRSSVLAGIEEDDEHYNNKLKSLLEFLRAEVEGEMKIALTKSGFGLTETMTKKEKRKPSEEVPTASGLHAGEKDISRCVFCEKAHESKECFKAQKMPLQEKTAILRKKNYCFVCLKAGHRSRFCRASVKCFICAKRHCTIMCPYLIEQGKKKDAEKEKEEKENVTLSNLCSKGEVFLQTLKVKLNNNGKERVARLLIDTGSQRSYILKSTANEMKYTPIGSETLIHALFGGVSSNKEKHSKYEITISSLSGEAGKRIEVLDQRVICGRIPCMKPGAWLDEIKEIGITCSDIGIEAKPIELLIGADMAGRFYTGKTHCLSCGVMAMETVLGWVVMGRVNGANCRVNVATSLLNLDDSLTSLWRLDALGITEPIQKQTEAEVEAAVANHFKKTVRKNEEDRYEVCLPWLEEYSEIQSNKVLAEKRLISTSAKLIEGGKFESYDGVFNEWLQEGIIEEVTVEENTQEFFLPHRGVFKSGSTTSVRPVFDASAKVKGHPSLNDCLAKGPNLIELLPSVLMRFRENRIGVTSDIRKAFLQISITKEDRKYLKFLWWEDYKEKRMKVFQHCRVVFGVNCSPFLLGAVINHHLSQYDPSLNGVTEKLRKSFYVDNCVTSVESEEELKTFREEAVRIMAEGKFDLRGWEHTLMDGEDTEKETSTVLGLLWNRRDDTLECEVSNISSPDGAITRRWILSLTQRVFDPIGILCPVTIIPKLMLQETWRAKVGWDTAMSEEVENQFRKWVESLSLLSEVKIPRYIVAVDGGNDTLHLFCDASGSAYSAVVFLRSESINEVTVTFVQAKSRVAPLKKATIPRLELLACSIGARLASSVKESMNREDIKEYYWTDSSTALHWIKEEDNWGIFVQNRVREIRRLTNVDDWLHIPGKENPADIPSRGCSAQKLVSSRWWEGPEWLKLKECEWPKSEHAANEEDVISERRKGINTMINGESEEVWFLRYFSNYVKCIRMIAWVKRFSFNSRRKAKDRRRGELTVGEFEEAEYYAVRYVQERAFQEEGRAELKSIDLYKDNEGMLRVRTKLTNLESHENFKYPMILPNKHEFTELVIRDSHVNNCHAGVNTILVKLREKFWIIRGRKTIRKVISKCVRCKRFQARRMNIAPGVLPEDRVDQDSSVFQVTGVDLAGPLFLRGGQKSWVVLFTCAVYRAIHLEVITSLSTRAFLLSLRRFISRRGRPKTIYSDNGTNFVGSDNLMGSLDWKKIENEAGLRRIEWKFIPPTAAWWGGWWERMVQMIKKLLRRVLGKASLEYEEVMTILADCEAVINSRPLTYVTDEADPLRPLSPAMFLQDNCTVGVPELDAIDREELNKRARYIQKIREELRKRFKEEYLANLLQPPMKGKSAEPLKVGDVVLVETDSKRIFWPMAKVVEVYPGQDGQVRVARLKTAVGELVRPAKRIFSLEIPCAAEEDTSKTEAEVKGVAAENHQSGEEENQSGEEENQSGEEEDHSGEKEDPSEKKKTVRTRSGRLIRIPARYL